ncbi:MAG TPA: ABC transporter permease [Sideroxyarcus sp.]|nr:ABC transporter permease [Sideroxyarcus sp.]
MSKQQYFALPRLSMRFFPIWRRHWLVWKKLAAPSILGHLADPVIYMLGLGYGLGSLLPEMGGMSYMAFLAAGTVCYSTMNSASFEALYSGFARMHEQRTWEAILNTPVSLDDVVLSEILWAATKSLMSGVAVLAVIWILGLSHSTMSLWMIPLALLIGLVFASIGLIMTALAPSYDFFMYYFTLVITPMMLLCGVFFPVSQLPESMQSVAAALPLTHAIDLARPLMNGSMPPQAAMHIAVLLAYTLAGFYVSLVLFRRRLSR